MSDLGRSMHRSLWAQVAHSSFIEGSHTTKNTTSENYYGYLLLQNSTYPYQAYLLLSACTSSTILIGPLGPINFELIRGYKVIPLQLVFPCIELPLLSQHCGLKDDVFLMEANRKKKMSTTNVGTRAMHISLELKK